MIDRKRYFELCQKNSVVPNSVNVIYQGGEYYPQALKIWFNSQGKTMNTAVLIDVNLNSITNCSLEDIEELTN